MRPLIIQSAATGVRRDNDDAPNREKVLVEAGFFEEPDDVANIPSSSEVVVKQNRIPRALLNPDDTFLRGARDDDLSIRSVDFAKFVDQEDPLYAGSLGGPGALKGSV